MNGRCVLTWIAPSISGILNCPIFFESRGSARAVHAIASDTAVRSQGRHCNVKSLAILESCCSAIVYVVHEACRDMLRNQGSRSAKKTDICYGSQIAHLPPVRGDPHFLLAKQNI